jgi:hypothetical protein
MASQGAERLTERSETGDSTLGTAMGGMRTNTATPATGIEEKEASREIERNILGIPIAQWEVTKTKLSVSQLFYT